jgi:hypothetical protein
MNEENVLIHDVIVPKTADRDPGGCQKVSVHQVGDLMNRVPESVDGDGVPAMGV